MEPCAISRSLSKHVFAEMMQPESPGRGPHARRPRCGLGEVAHRAREGASHLSRDTANVLPIAYRGGLFFRSSSSFRRLAAASVNSRGEGGPAGRFPEARSSIRRLRPSARSLRERSSSSPVTLLAPPPRARRASGIGDPCAHVLHHPPDSFRDSPDRL